MAYFAVVKDRDNKAFSVPTCHINLWALPGVAGYCFQFDVGIRIRAAENGLTGFLLALPFTVSRGGVEDLHDLVVRRETAELIFGEPVTVQGETVSFGKEEEDRTVLRVGRIHTQKCAEVTEWSSRAKHCSVWKIDLASVINNGEEQYLRMRFPIERLGRRWMPKRSLLADNGAVMDFRVSDIREAQEAMDWASLRDRIVSIERLNAFVIAPVSLQLRSASPELKYMRLLEGDAWGPYIRRRTGIFRPHQLLTFYWRADNVSVERPFRGFLDLSREFGVSSWANHVRIGVVAVLFVVAALYVREEYTAIDPQLVRSWLLKIGYPAGGLTAITVTMWIFRSRKSVKYIYALVQQSIVSIDKLIYGRS